MKREELVLNVVCVALAVLFLGLAVMNIFMAGDFFTIDSLFFTLVFLLLAMVAMVNPIFTLLPVLPVPKRFRRAPVAVEGAAPARAVAGTAAAKAALPPGQPRPIIRDARGRPVPADVRNILLRMKEPGEQKALGEG